MVGSVLGEFVGSVLAVGIKVVSGSVDSDDDNDDKFKLLGTQSAFNIFFNILLMLQPWGVSK